MSQNNKKTVIAIDAMGGDHGPQVTVPAAIKFLQGRNNLDQHQIILVGLSERIEPLVHSSGGDKFIRSGHLSVQHATEIVEMNEPPAHALKRKKDSSMRVAINLVKQGAADACVSAGNTGALMATARFVLKTIKGIERPAIISTMPCKDTSQTIHMLDLGANVDSSPEMLLEFAVMGSVITKFVDKKENPSIALLNVGAEEIKGSEKVKKTSALLAQSDLNYVGYIESNELFDSKVDVIVCDGFEGNVALKASEGTASMIFGILKQEFTRSFLSKLVAMLAKPVLKRIQSRLDPRRHNGATLIGLNGVVVKSHGGTDEFGFLHAVEEASLQARRDVIAHISEEIEKTIVIN